MIVQRFRDVGYFLPLLWERNCVDAKHKGALAELQACAWLLREGYEVFRNVSQAGVADLMVWKPGESPFPVEVRTLHYIVAADGKTCSITTNKTPRHSDVRLLFAYTKTGDCGFDPEPLVAAQGYTLRPPPRPFLLVCTVGGCDQKHRARGFCRMHYKHWHRGLVDGCSLALQRP